MVVGFLFLANKKGISWNPNKMKIDQTSVCIRKWPTRSASGRIRFEYGANEKINWNKLWWIQKFNWVSVDFGNFEFFLSDQQNQSIKWSLLLHRSSGWSPTVSLTNSIISAALPMQPTISWVFSSLRSSFWSESRTSSFIMVSLTRPHVGQKRRTVHESVP